MTSHIAFLVHIRNFYPAGSSQRDLRLASTTEDITFAGMRWLGGLLEIESITQIKIEESEERPHFSFTILGKSEAVNNRAREPLGPQRVTILQIER